MQCKALALALVAVLGGAGVLLVRAETHAGHEHHEHHEHRQSRDAQASGTSYAANTTSVGADGNPGQYKRPKQLTVPADAPQVWMTECGSCHMAYPPGLLPPAAWKQHMDTLKNHYGSDASLDPREEQTIREFLMLVSSNNRLPVESSGVPGEQPRITDTRWFTRRHHEVSAEKFAREAVGGPGNCVACHRNAETGSFGKVKIPR